MNSVDIGLVVFFALVVMGIGIRIGIKLAGRDTKPSLLSVGDTVSWTEKNSGVVKEFSHGGFVRVGKLENTGMGDTRFLHLSQVSLVGRAKSSGTNIAEVSKHD